MVFLNALVSSYDSVEFYRFRQILIDTFGNQLYSTMGDSGDGTGNSTILFDKWPWLQAAP